MLTDKNKRWILDWCAASVIYKLIIKSLELEVTSIRCHRLLQIAEITAVMFSLKAIEIMLEVTGCVAAIFVMYIIL